ncbi:DUF2948 family protein [Methylocella tundrae]|uniref:DUF2948 domain-containing protein n=1 Tax=Methylocella tundrae TaxID=227605 RepID=A0A4U8Z1A1_METTU|nr:DUF2948 family protein [Methylocella tundrae]WPP03104.1 DUF2948 family protein [Methylocella tundrae]VFU09061.1 conserved protein of unknown function [Methylocella tundrae]
MSETAALQQLRLVAFDQEDLEVISANLQDALVQVGDMAFLADSKQFAFLAARFDWVKAATGCLERCRTGLHFERVLKVSCAGFAQRDKTRILNLLSIGFRETAAPGGEIDLIFSGGCALRLQVECLEARLRDRDERWKAKALPGHPCNQEPRSE